MEPSPGSSSSTVPGGGGTGAVVGSSAGGSGAVGGSVVTRPPITALFREIHKNSWLRRLNNDSRRPSVLTKKPDRYWVVFCVHDDCEAFLEGYSDPRQAPSHAPEWALSLQTVQHVSHALVSIEQEFEFVITLGSEVARFNANTWECMQEWVECLRSKLREMKLLSPKENLYSRLPEVRPPLAPTRDPTSPLPATPPVPAAIVPGIERVQPSSLVQQQHHGHHSNLVGVSGQATSLPSGPSGSGMASGTIISNTGTTSSISSSSSSASSASSSSASSSSNASNSSGTSYSSTLTSISNCPNSERVSATGPPAMSNTSTQNLMNLLSNPLQAVSSINAQTSKPLSGTATDSISLGSSSSLVSEEEPPEEQLKCNISASPPRDSPPSSSLPKPQKIIHRESAGHNGGAAHHNHHPVVTHASGTSTTTSSLATTFVTNVLADPSGTAGPSLKRTMIDKKLLLDVRQSPERSGATECDVGSSASDAINGHTNDALPNDESWSRQPQQNGSSSNGRNGTATVVNGGESTVSSPSMLTKSAAICIGSPASSGARAEPKRTRRKISPVASSSPRSPTVANGEDQVANVTIIQVSNSANGTTPSPTITTASSPKPPVSRFNFPKAKPSIITPTTVATGVSTIITDDPGPGNDHNYKSNVQIIPSNVEYPSNGDQLVQPSIIASINEQQITTVTVPNVSQSVPIPSSTVMSTPRTQPSAPATVQVAVATSSTPIKGPESNFGTVTQIAVNSSSATGDGPGVSKPIHCQPPATQQSSSNSQHYEQVFLTSSVQVTSGSVPIEANFEEQAIVSVAPILSKPTGNKSSKVLLLSRQSRSSSHSDIPLPARLAIKGTRTHEIGGGNDKENRVQHDSIIGGNVASSGTASTSKQGSVPTAGNATAPIHLTGGSPSKRPAVDRNIYTPHPQRAAAPLLQRGLTELVLSTRPAATSGTDHSAMGGRGRRAPVEHKIRSEHLPPEQRRRSSSTSDARQEHSARINGTGANGVGPGPGRLQSPPQPFRPHHQLMNVPEGNQQLNGGTNGVGHGTPTGGVGGNRKLTLREQQVFQLRREMMHPGGVRLQLRRKDCINSIGLVDAFGAVWVAGWKQKEHPVLYNALHIGDQMISVAGVAIMSAADAHKAIRAAPGLFVELIIRRVPFGRVYAIRRELDGQCLGLIRDGNTSTIVDVVPNSLAARHGLPPKAKSCDGLSLTFWVLTEINGRPLNLFFKENEIRDRLNAVGRDISILVQPADLVTKLKKQLKSLRGHKDFIVQ
ncbi:mucin-5AC [Anopheles moucheti]|uniref:mucin-5AC n=1 Tax=Anopheles moucheti TaxID=186751 RepID=UPI0022EFFC0A|nr:mucin-5AC [Anopheles moucheti]